MKVLVTGGAGYIGSVTVAALQSRGDEVAVFDNLVTGHREAVTQGCGWYEGDLLDGDALREAFLCFRPDAVVHFAALSQVAESVADPARYFRNNVTGTMALLEAMRESDCRFIVFSSTAAVYGIPDSLPITELSPTRPVNPYGWTKLLMEEAMRAFSEAYGLRAVCLRYFNAAGAAGPLGEDHRPETHLIPVVLQAALGQRPSVKVFGTDYSTPDGTCIRDYIHVADLADAHLRALDYLSAGGATVSCNLGNGQGYSVRQVIDVCRKITGLPINVEEVGSRMGDPPRLVADASRAREILGWEPRRPDLETIVADAYAWHRKNPNGYRPVG